MSECGGALAATAVIVPLAGFGNLWCAGVWSLLAFGANPARLILSPQDRALRL